MKQLTINPNNKPYYSEDFIKGFECGTQRQLEADLADRKDEPQTETQTETQNSNLTFEKRTMRDCYNCKRYENDCECRECNYEPKDKPQTERK